MYFANTCNLKQVVNLILCWFGVFSSLPLSFPFDFWSHCLAFGTVRKQFSPESKLDCIMNYSAWHTASCSTPCSSSPKVWGLPFHTFQSPFSPLPLLFPPPNMAVQQAGTLAPDWICFIFKFQVTSPPSSWSASECNHMRQAVST